VRNRQFHLAGVFDHRTTLCQRLLRDYSNTMVLYIVSIVIAMVGAGGYWLIQYEPVRSAAAGGSFG
jgi:hypothetical protein